MDKNEPENEMKTLVSNKNAAIMKVTKILEETLLTIHPVIMQLFSCSITSYYFFKHDC